MTGPNVTATATDAAGNTSEFSAPFFLDTDCDCMLDTYEAPYACLDPLVADATGNPDGDTLMSFAEMTVATDACLANPEHALDTDADQFSDGLEQYVGTSPADNCADTPTANDEADDRWPLDMDNDKTVSAADILSAYPGRVSPPVQAGMLLYNRRFDLNVDSKLSAADVLQYAGKVAPPTTCT